MRAVPGLVIGLSLLCTVYNVAALAQSPAAAGRASQPAAPLAEASIAAREIGWLVAFLVSPRSSAVNGESIPCDGGTPNFVRY